MRRNERERDLRPRSANTKYSEHAKENLDLKDQDKDKAMDSDKEGDEEEEDYVPLTLPKTRRRSTSSSPHDPLGLSGSRRMTRNSNSNSNSVVEVDENGDDVDSINIRLDGSAGRGNRRPSRGVSTKIVLNSSRQHSNVQDRSGTETETDGSEEDDDFDVELALEKKRTRASANLSKNQDDPDVDVDVDQAEIDELYAAGQSDESDDDGDSTCDYQNRGVETAIDEQSYVRRSLRAHHVKQGSYNSSQSWLVGGGGEAKGYRSSRLSRSRGSSRHSRSHDEIETIRTSSHRDRPHSQQSRASSLRHSTRTMNPSVVMSPCSQPSQRQLRQRHRDEGPPVENGIGGRDEEEEEEEEDVEMEDDTEPEDDMYSRVKAKNRLRGRSSGTKKLTMNEEPSLPVSTRLRDRNKLSRISAASYGESEHEPQLDKVLRKNRRHKRRRGGNAGRDRSSSNSSSSTTDSDDTQLQSPSKKKAKRKFATGTENLKGVGLVAKKELKMLMEVQPIAVDPSITFKSVGGLGNFIDKLKEIVLFPLLYHEFYEQRGMSAPRGILLHGPPGTGKTLLARALSNECSNINGRKVSFFLRKGADLLNKFVGESERQLRMLFQQAALHQPSIIFFDEIDGLAPVRSAKSDQIHNSIVSSLLAEIDGLQDRGSIIVMGSTNRLDFVDPALRRPGRFDCELPIFLPTRNGRREILSVHVSKWKDPPLPSLLDELADRSIGFNGADLKFLCWQSTMNSLRRTYPQIYGSSQKYLLDYDSIKIDRDDWEEALKSIGPSTQRSLFSTYSPAQPLPAYIKPLLRKGLEIAEKFMDNIFPSNTLSLVTESSVKRFLIQSEVDSGLNTFLIPALLHAVEKVPVYVLSFEALHMDGGGNVEFCVTQKCMEVMKQAKPCICYLPDFERLCDLLSDSSKEILIRMMNQSLHKPILFLATVEGDLSRSFGDSCSLMPLFSNRILKLPPPSGSAVTAFFQPVFEQASKVKRVQEVHIDKLEELPLAPPEAPIKPKYTEEELRSMEKQENSTFRELRIFLRQILTKLARNKKFEEFTRPVDIEEVPDYLDVISHPMDFEAMMFKLNSNVYCSAKEFMDDIHLIHSNCISYNPHKSESDKRLRMRAFELKDFAEKLIEDEMDSDFERECHKILKARKDRSEGLEEADSTTMDTGNQPQSQKKQPKRRSSILKSTPGETLPSSTTPVNSAARIKVRNETSPTSSALSNCGQSGSAPNSRPTSARFKRRRSSAWSKGSLAKKKLKRPGPLTKTVLSSTSTLSNAARNLEKKSFSKLAGAVEPDTETEDVVVDVVGDHSPAREAIVAAGSSPPPPSEEVEMVSVPSRRFSQSQSERDPGIGSSGTSSSSLAVLPYDGSNSRGVDGDNFYPCNNASHYTRLFQDLLFQTVELCKDFSVVKLIDHRFQLLRLVTKHQASEDKEELHQELKDWIKGLGHGQEVGGGRARARSGSGNAVKSATTFSFPATQPPIPITSGLHTNRNHHQSRGGSVAISDRGSNDERSTSTSTGVVATAHGNSNALFPLKVKAPATSAPAQLRFSGLERSQKRRSKD